MFYVGGDGGGGVTKISLEEHLPKCNEDDLSINICSAAIFCFTPSGYVIGVTSADTRILISNRESPF